MPPYVKHEVAAASSSSSSTKAKPDASTQQGEPEEAQESESGRAARTKPMLTEEQKKANHIQSEQRRREKIREQYDKLADLTPGMAGQGRSEGKVLEEVVKMAAGLISERERLIREVEARGGIVDQELKDWNE